MVQNPVVRPLQKSQYGMRRLTSSARLQTSGGGRALLHRLQRAEGSGSDEDDRPQVLHTVSVPSSPSEGAPLDLLVYVLADA